MTISYFNGQFLPHDDIRISPDERGFLFADGIYEVVRWYGGFFFDMESHIARLKRSLAGISIVFEDADMLPQIATELIHRNELGDCCASVYIQITRGAARRKHSFPDPPVPPTVYATASRLSSDTVAWENGIGVSIVPDMRWTHCDIKSIALLPNVIAFQQALDNGFREVIFVRDGVVTEASHANAFFIRDNVVYTHPESNYILSGITRKNIIRIASENSISVNEEAVPDSMLPYMHEAFLANTSGEIVPVVKIGDMTIGDGTPGPLTRRLQNLFRENLENLRTKK
ncbi:MAG TPA: aminotransferase class IV [Bacteroidales bacterium]|nr:aminotransferase class IV [Bacteroidales bacterium]HPT12319.1 aminotransferase class IV [Bacteroidales bacterium]